MNHGPVHDILKDLEGPEPLNVPKYICSLVHEDGRPTGVTDVTVHLYFALERLFQTSKYSKFYKTR